VAFVAVLLAITVIWANNAHTDDKDATRESYAHDNTIPVNVANAVSGMAVDLNDVDVSAAPYAPCPPGIITEPEETTEQESEWISLGEYTLSAYCLCVKCCGIWSKQHPTRINDPKFVQKTASGTIPTAERTIGVNPAVIPYGTEVLINGHVYIAEDTGAAAKRKKLIDIYHESHDAALKFGRQTAEIFIRKWD